MKMKKKSERKLKKEEIRKKLEEAIELRAKKLKEYRETPTKKHLEKIVGDLDISDDAAILIAVKDGDNLAFKGIKCKTSDLVAMVSYTFTKVVQNDIGGVMDCVSTIARQEELNDCWVEHNEKPEEIEDGNAENSK